jgi:hypothetical protein
MREVTNELTTGPPRPKAPEIKPPRDRRRCRSIATARRTDPTRAALLGLSACFGVQAVTASWVITGAVGGFAWLAVVADPLTAAWFLFLPRRTPVQPRRRRHGTETSPAEIRRGRA